MSTFETGRRLCLLFEAGACRFAIEATAVMEVASPDADGRTLRGSLELKPLTALLSGALEPEDGPGMAVVLDVSPTLALRVRRVHEVADVARDRFFGIPPALGEALAFVSRGAILHDHKLFLELKPEAIPHQPLKRLPPRMRPVFLVDRPPDRALIFESQGVLWGVPLTMVQQVVAATQAFLPLPVPSGPVAGLFPHDQLLWPIFSAPALIGGVPAREEFFVLAELAGEAAGLCASRVYGVFGNFQSTEGRGEFTAPGLERPILVLDWQRMFS
ncbi:MAG: defective in fruiting DifE [Myxococcaceae bacterium]|nr:defective in fruiting DifE [Myxococcaceae bacterium]